MNIEQYTIGELQAMPHSFEAMKAQDVLRGLYGGMQALAEQKAGQEAGNETASRFSFPTAEGGAELSLDEKAAYLAERSERIHIEILVEVGLAIGAERLDAMRMKQGLEPIHFRTLQELLVTQRRESVFQAGREEIMAGNFRGASMLARPIATRVDKYFPELANPVALYDAVGANYRTRSHAAKPAILTQATEGVMQSERWDDKSRAVYAALGIHHAAIRSARQLIMPLLTKEADLPRMTEGFEQKFWERKLFGNAQGDGVFYYLGYLDKSRPAMRAILKDKWGENDYYRNRQVLTAAMFLRPAAVPQKDRVDYMRKLRRPVFLLMSEGHFEAAEELLRKAANERPDLFGLLSREYLLGKDSAPKSPEDPGDPL